MDPPPQAPQITSSSLMHVGPSQLPRHVPAPCSCTRPLEAGPPALLRARMVQHLVLLAAWRPK